MCLSTIFLHAQYGFVFIVHENTPATACDGMLTVVANIKFMTCHVQGLTCEIFSIVIRAIPSFNF